MSERSIEERLDWWAQAKTSSVRLKALLREAAAEIRRLREELREMTSRAVGHAYASSMAEGGEELTSQELCRERADHADTREELAETKGKLAVADAEMQRVRRLLTEALARIRGDR